MCRLDGNVEMYVEETGCDSMVRIKLTQMKFRDRRSEDGYEASGIRSLGAL